MKRAASLSLIVAVLLAVAATAYWLGRRHPASPAVARAAPGVTASGKILYWYDPMLPQQHFDRPGLSPMGMQMVPKYADAEETLGTVRIDPVTVQNLGVRVAPVQRRVLDEAFLAPGTVTWDLRQAVTVSARVDEVIAHLYVRAPYALVAAGAPLADVLAPQWRSALAEDDALRHTQSPDAQALRAAARERLAVLGLTAADLRTANRQPDGAITLHAPEGGVVTDLPVREGQRVNAGQTLMTINSLATVWIDAALPQALAGTVRSGTPVTVTVDAQPGRVFPGTVETVLPEIDPATRTQRARIVLANPQHVLSPGMFATVHLAPALGGAVLVIPNEALITTGHAARVIVALGQGRFRPVAVRTGRSSGGYTEILSGLADNEHVVTSGQFLIDSEANLSGALERMTDHPGTPAPTASTSTPGTPLEGKP